AASISNRKSSSSAAAMRGKDSLTFVLHPKQLVALRSKTTEVLYGGANRGKRAVLFWSGWRHIEGRLTPRFRTIESQSQCCSSPITLDNGVTARCGLRVESV